MHEIGLDEDEPIGLQTLTQALLTRRALLGGAVSAPLLGIPGLAQAVEEKLQSADWQLHFELSSGERVLRISETRTGITPPPLAWVLPADAFGPKAWFDMSRPEANAKPDRRTLWIRECAFGNRHGVEMRFDFERAAGASGASRWSVVLRADPWSVRSSTRSVPLHEFIGRKVTLDALVDTAVMLRAFRGIFATTALSARSAPSQCTVSFDPDACWTVYASSCDALLAAFDQQIEWRTTRVAWRRSRDRAAYFSGRSPDASFASRPAARCAPTPAAPLVLGPASGHHVRVDNVTNMQGLVDIRIGASPIVPKWEQTILHARFPRAELQVLHGSAVLASELPVGGLSLTVSALPSTDRRTALLRTVLWCDACPTDGCERPAPVLITTQIGRMRIGARPPEVPPPKAGQADPESGIPGAAVPAAPAAPAVSAAGAASEAVCAQGPDARADSKTGGQPIPDDANSVARLFRAASGDRAGVQEWTVFGVFDRAPGTGMSVLRRLSLDVMVHDAMVAVPDTSFSSLRFGGRAAHEFLKAARDDRGTDLRLHFEDGLPLAPLPYSEFPRPFVSSFVWLAPVRERGLARAALDLSRAQLTCARDRDLMKLRFRFKDLHLSFPFGRPPEIAPANDTCRVRVRDDGTVEDNRPVLVAEFDPQHVMEEAILLPEPLPLPDVELEKGKLSGFAGEDRYSIVAKVEASQDFKERKDLREFVRAQKRKAPDNGDDKAEAERRQVFGRFADAFEKAATKADIPLDQAIYVGPYALEPDAMAVARGVQQNQTQVALASVVEKMLERVEVIYQKLAKPPGPVVPVDPDKLTPDSDLAGPRRALMLRNEALLEQQEPLYGLFRDHWRELAVRARMRARNEATAPARSASGPGARSKEGSEPSGWLDEYLTDSNRPEMSKELSEPYLARLISAKKDFVLRVGGRTPDDLKGLMGARLSNRSRLAFHLNCEVPSGLTAEETGTAGGSDASPAHPAAGSTRYGPMPFTFEALTDWSRHEPAVTRRAQRLFDALPWGGLPPLGSRAANVNDLDILRFQGIAPGPVTGVQRMNQIRASLAVLPNEMQTVIELPARLLLSTAQDAVWRTPRKLPSEVIGVKGDSPIVIPDPIGPRKGMASPPKPAQQTGRPSLWTARLSIGDVPPHLRAIGSPDFRPMALERFQPANLFRLPGHGAPPRGPWAPWFLGPEQMDTGTLMPQTVANSMPQGAGVADCANPSADVRWRLYNLLCQAFLRRQSVVGEGYLYFRTSLDAFDRHQLVLLSSAYGLPVTGRRSGELQALPPATTGSTSAPAKAAGKLGALVANSGQIEPGSKYALIDGRDDQAIYRPIPLKVAELSLSAIGGSLRHDTTFQPAAGADDVFGHKMFEGFSILRYRHDIVLGRDERVDVVYKGYLLPFGHLSSFVKLTQRIFILTKEEGIKALLRTRFFLQSTKQKVFPAVGQPFEGRLWFGKVVALLTTESPDLIDPAFPLGPPADASLRESLNGRIYLNEQPGIAFWPRTDLTEAGIYKFEIAIDQAKARVPLMFVDNIAATNALAVQAAVDHYNGALPDGAAFQPLRDALLKRREVAMGSQAVAYAKAYRSGDTSYPTESVILAANGQSAGQLTTWTGGLTDYQTSGVLEGADQPPFYPRMQSAKVRLGQVERFSGAGGLVADVQYDGHYVRFGLPEPEAAAPDGGTPPPPNSAAGNTSEVFLNLAQMVKLDMGSQGDRSAGIARPQTQIIALSRKYGPLGGSEKVRWRKAPNGTQDEPRIEVVKANSNDLVSLASHFSWTDQTAVEDKPDARLSDDAPAIRRKYSLTDADKGKPQEHLQRLAVLKSYFSGDAKLLGVITLQQLLELLDLGKLEFPALREVTEFGASVTKAMDEAAGSVVSALRSQVLSPLREVLDRLRTEWDRLDEMIVQRQQSLGVPVGSVTRLGQLYADLDGALESMRKAVEAAYAAESAEEIPDRLAILYESAQQLIRVLAAMASHPVERLEEAVVASLQRSLDFIRNKVTVFGADPAIRSMVAELSNPNAGKTAEMLVDALAPRQIEAGKSGFVGLLPLFAQRWFSPASDEGWAQDLFGIVLPPPDLAAVARILNDPVHAALPAEALSEVDAIAREIRKMLAGGAQGVLQDFLEQAVEEILRRKEGAAPDERWMDEVLQSAVKKFKSNAETAIGAAKSKLGASSSLSKAKGLLAQATSLLDAYGKRVDDELDKTNGAWASSPALVAARRRAQSIASMFERLRSLAEAVKSGDAGTIFPQAAPVLQDLLGVDVQALDATVSQAVGSYFDQALAGAAQLMGIRGMTGPNLAQLAAEVDWCQRYRRDLAAAPVPNPQLASTAMLLQIAQAITALSHAKSQLEAVEKQIDGFENALKKGKDPKPAAVVQLLTEIKLVKKLHGTLQDLVWRKSPDSLWYFLRQLYVATVDATVAMSALQGSMSGAAPSSWDRFDRAALERIAVQARTLRAASEEAARAAANTVGFITRFLDQNADYVKPAGLLAASAAAAPGDLSARLANAVGELQLTESVIAAAVKQGFNLVARFLTSFASESAQAVATARASAAQVAAALSRVQLEIPESRTFLEDLATLENEVRKLRPLSEIKDSASSRLDDLLKQRAGPNNTTLTEFFATVGSDPSKLRSSLGLTPELETAEASAAATWHAIVHRLEGVPESLKQRLFAVLMAKGFGAMAIQLSDTYQSLLGKRNEVQLKLGKSPLTTGLASVLRVEVVTPYPATCAPDLATCDLLDQEAQALRAVADSLKKFGDTQTFAMGPAERNNLMRFLMSWRDRKKDEPDKTALLQILDNAKNTVVRLIQAEALAAIDLASFRDQFEDAVADLIPVRTKLNYDFVSAIDSEPDDNAIFQPQNGSTFSLRVRATTDLLKPEKSTFATQGEFGPFKIKLVGGLLDALTLSFSGAGFEMANGAKPRFDVAYEGFKIGTALKFVEQLEPFLSPDGSGFFIQPMTSGVGVEAGYGIDLASIGVGASSFFNVILNVSVELPFDDREAMFKVALGRRESPFSISVVPFCGSGFFSVFADARGIRGFEASFEFGGGGSLQFGPLKAQCRIQVGVYTRVLKAGNHTLTTIEGTFFAGGSASIWIFSFSTSLIVRLGQQPGGSMQGMAVYSFSFSLGFAKYRYSVAAQHTEKQLGSRGASESKGKPESTKEKQGSTKQVLLDSGLVLVGYAAKDRLETTADRRKRGSKTSTGSKAAQAAKISLTVSASGQRDWATYGTYFNHRLVDGLATLKD